MDGRRKTRNICILAHVDHGKTTLADHLIAGAGDGAVHPKLAGKLRYMDYRDDEQQRAITMKSASIMLKFGGHNINLIDSPGHIDFCSEVSTAVRLSDGGLVLVDVCEGVHIQTHAVLRQAFAEHVKPCLVLNKMDRLITELQLTPMEAYTRMQGIVTEVNNIVSGFRSERYLSDVDSILADKPAESKQNDEDVDESLEDAESEQDEFQPHKGNVAFSSAIDGWAFRTLNFAKLYAEKLGASESLLVKCLWGDFFLKGKKIVGKKAAAGKLKPMFVQLVLEPLWQVYNSITEGKTDILTKVIKSMSLSIPPRELQNRDPKVVVQAVMSRWLSLPDSILQMVVDVLPDPAGAQLTRTAHMLPRRLVAPSVSPDIQAEIESVRKAVEACDVRPHAPCVTFVSKMFAVPVEMLPRHGPSGEPVSSIDWNAGDLDSSNRECFLAFARVFSGVIYEGQKVFVLSALYDPTESQQDKKNVQVATVDALYMMKGRELQPCDKVSAGNVVAIRGLGQYILKSATLCSTVYCWPFASLHFQAAPIVRVAVEPSDPANLKELLEGLKLLNKADPFVEVSQSSTGEHVISAAGEVHLELCIKDLKERFARIDLEVSKPLVAFRETIDEDTSDSVDRSKQAQAGYGESTTINGRCTVRAHVTRMPRALIQVLDENADLLKNVLSGKKLDTVTEGAVDPAEALRTRLVEAAKDDGESKKRENGFEKQLQRIWALGPRGVGPNILLVPDYRQARSKGGTSENGDITPAAQVHGFAHASELLGFPVEPRSKDDAAPSSLVAEADGLAGSIVAGFQVATSAGPLCDEPAWGLVFTIEAFIRESTSTTENTESHPGSGVFSGQVITAVKEACRAAVLSRRPRLVEAMYLCEVSTSSLYLGQMYGVLAKRRARVLKEEMREGTDMFTVHAFMPVAESFGFAEELRRKTSGAASPQLMLSHWEQLCEDPFFVPKTEEEVEEFGDGSSIPQNTARKLMDAVRRRKGLPVEEKHVRHATKQRTLAKKV